MSTPQEPKKRPGLGDNAGSPLHPSRPPPSPPPTPRSNYYQSLQRPSAQPSARGSLEKGNSFKVNYARQAPSFGRGSYPPNTPTRLQFPRRLSGLRSHPHLPSISTSLSYRQAQSLPQAHRNQQFAVQRHQTQTHDRRPSEQPEFEQLASNYASDGFQIRTATRVHLRYGKATEFDPLRRSKCGFRPTLPIIEEPPRHQDSGHTIAQQRHNNPRSQVQPLQHPQPPPEHHKLLNRFQTSEGPKSPGHHQACDHPQASQREPLLRKADEQAARKVHFLKKDDKKDAVSESGERQRSSSVKSSLRGLLGKSSLPGSSRRLLKKPSLQSFGLRKTNSTLGQLPKNKSLPDLGQDLPQNHDVEPKPKGLRRVHSFFGFN